MFDNIVTIIVSIVFVIAIVIAGMPWLAQRIFHGRTGIWVGGVELLLVGGLLSYWIYILYKECSKAAYVGNTVVVDEGACRTLYFMAIPATVIITVVSVLSLILGLSIVFLSRWLRRAQQPIPRRD